MWMRDPCAPTLRWSHRARRRATLVTFLGLTGTLGCSGPGPSDAAFGEGPDAASGQASEAGSPEGGSGKSLGPASVDVDATVVDSGQRDSGQRADGATEDADGRRGAADADRAEDAGPAPPHGDAGDAGDGAGGDPETGRMAGITAAHNAVRAAVQTTPPLEPLVWSPTVAAYAQAWATSLAATMCAQPVHRSGAELQAKDYGENLATFGGGGRGAAQVSTAEEAVNAWAAEKACWTYGTIQGTEACNTACYTNLHSDGCGHYTQVVWRGSKELGCGVATCQNGAFMQDIWICNYAPAGNFIGQAPY